MTLPVIAVVGRPNVGKSTFFNRVIGERLAIVDDRPGVTRDRNFARADWAGRGFFIVDTGGILEDPDQAMDKQIRKQALRAIEEADALVLLVDGKEGLHPLDEKVAEILRKTNKPARIAVNKQDNLPIDQGHHEFWGLGLGDPIPVSAISGKGSGELLDAMVEMLPPADPEDDDPNRIRIAVVGRPNVGKSSFVNRIFGEERSVVSEVSGTTRDPVDSEMKYHGHDLVFVDTAGLRRQSKVNDNVEYYSALRTAKVVEDADICLVLVDATEGIAHQDLRVIDQAWSAGAGVGILVNKWDLVEKDTMTAPNFEKSIREKAPFLQWIPFLFTSALTGQRAHKALDLVLEIHEERRRRISTSESNEVLEKLVRRTPAPLVRGREVNLKYVSQVAVEPPTFVIFTNVPKGIPDNYIRYIHNGFRAAWGFMGTDIRIRFRSSSNR